MNYERSSNKTEVKVDDMGDISQVRLMTSLAGISTTRYPVPSGYFADLTYM